MARNNVAADTIYALSSGPPPAGIGVIRISGPEAHRVHLDFAGRSELPPFRHASLASLRDPAGGELLDHALTLVFDGPRSATGEDMTEWHCHGGQAVLAGVLNALARQPYLRPAEPGEFTRRALQNGRIDLMEAEGLADLLTAQTQTQRRAALVQAEGALSRHVEGWRQTVLTLSARVEAELDFADEGDVEEAGQTQTLVRIRSDLKALAQDMRAMAAMPSAERLGQGICVVIAGPPNAGKSTLLNALVGREAAIVSDIAGTTRDRIEISVSLGDLPFQFIDTAGLREDSSDAIEAIGIDRARLALQSADMILWLGPPEDAPPAAMRIRTMIDIEGQATSCDYDHYLSARTGAGMAELVERLVVVARDLLRPEAEFMINERQRRLVGSCELHVRASAEQDDLLLVAEELRLARLALDQLTGRADVEDVLDTLFGRFCIGK